MSVEHRSFHCHNYLTYNKFLIFSMYMMIFSAQALASVGDLAPWACVDILFRDIPKDIRDTYSQNLSQMSSDEHFNLHTYYSPGGELNIYSPGKEKISSACNKKRECLYFISYKRDLDGRMSTLKLWLNSMQDTKPKLNHRADKDRTVSFHVNLGGREVALIIYSEGQIEIQSK